MGMGVVTVNDVLDGHLVLDIECLDRIYLNACVPTLQTSAQVAAFLTRHLGFPFRSPALFKQLGDRFRRSVRAFADAGDIPWVTFDKHDNKLEVMRPHLARQAATGRSGVAAVGVAQEFQRVCTAYQRQTQTGAPQYCFTKADRRVTCYCLLPVGRRLRPGVCQGVRLVPLPGQGLAQRARVGQAAGSPRRDRLCRVVQMGLPPAMTPRRCRPSVTGWDRPPQRVHLAVAVAAATALWRDRPRCRLLVGVLDAADRGLPHHRV